MKSPVSRQRRWVVVSRRPGAAAYVNGPFTFEKAEALAADPKWSDAAIGVYELRGVGNQQRNLQRAIQLARDALDSNQERQPE